MSVPARPEAPPRAADPPRDDAAARQARTTLGGAARLAREAAEALERGQAEAPLTALFDAALADLEGGPLPLVIAALSPEARAPAAAALLGREAAAAAQALAPGFGVADLPGAAGLHAVLPETLASISASPAALTRVVAAAGFLVVAGPPGAALSEGDRAALADILESTDAVLPVVVGEAKPARSGWWSDPALAGKAERLPPLGIPANSDLPERSAAEGRAESKGPVLLGKDDPLRGALSLAHLARRLRLAAGTLDERHKADARQIAARQSALSRQGGALEEAVRGAGEQRAAWDAARAEAQEALQKLGDELDEAARKALLPTGKLVETLKGRAALVEPKDLAREDQPQTVRLSLDATFVRALADETLRLARESLKDDLALVRGRLHALAAAAATRLATVAPAFRLELATPDEARLWDQVRAVFVLEPRYKGELPKRGFMHRLSEGRRPVFVVMMLMSVLGGVFGFTRRSAWLAYVMFGLFVAGFIQTFFTFRTEEDERLGREVERVKEQLEEEMKRAASDLWREKQARVAGEVAELKREAQRRLDAAAKEAHQSVASSTDDEKEKLRSRAKGLEQRSRDLASVGQKVARVLQSVGEADLACRRLLADQVRARGR